MSSGPLSERAIIVAPTGRDAAVATTILREAGFPAEARAHITDLNAEMTRGVGLAVIADEALATSDLRGLSQALATQPAWSDFPIIVLTRQGGGPERNPAAARLAELLGNVTFLERPFHPTTFISTVRTAVRGRRRQYQLRSTLTELSGSKQTLQTALEAGRLGSWTFEIGKRTFAASTSCKSHYGRESDEPFSYNDLCTSVHPEDRMRMQKAFDAAIEGGTDYVIEYRNVWPDGSVHWVDVRGTPTKGADGVVVHLTGVSSDITERKNAEEERERLLAQLAKRESELSALAQTLENRVEERTKKLHEAEAVVRQIQKMEVMNQLTSGVAHDFNNLLMAVIGNLDLLRKQHAADTRSSRLIDGAMQGAQRGAVLTQRMLAFSRQQELRTDTIDLGKLIAGTRELLERTLGPQFHLALSITDRLPHTQVDANQIELAILNLVINARDAMPNGGVIEILADYPENIPSALPPGNYVRLAIRDTGTGMSPTTLEKAIEPFFSTKGLGKGTGLGLSMVHGLAVQLGGLFQLSSVEGMGTTATLWLPAVSTQATEVAREMTPPSGSSRKARILVVDDDALISMATVDMLEDLGHTVIEADSGPRALDILTSDRNIDVLMTDYAMPGMTGMELASLARQKRPGLPILLATGFADVPAGQKLDVPRLSKPYLQDSLKTEIDKLLASSSTS
jgi:PAS domain S-box-containing protein